MQFSALTGSGAAGPQDGEDESRACSVPQGCFEAVDVQMIEIPPGELPARGIIKIKAPA